MHALRSLGGAGALVWIALVVLAVLRALADEIDRPPPGH